MEHMPTSTPIKPNFPVIVTSYEVVMADRKFLSKYNFKYLVVGEGHRLKNFDCKLIRELKYIPTANKLLLTGTPLQNNLPELWSLLHFLLPDVFSSLSQFRRHSISPKHRQRRCGRRGRNWTSTSANTARASSQSCTVF